MKNNLIRSYKKSWREREPLCKILRAWHGKEGGDRMIEKFATQPIGIKELVEKIVKNDSSPEAVEFEQIKQNWEKIVPATIKDSVFPVFLKDNILFVKVNNSCAMMELTLKTSEIITAIKKHTSFSVARVKCLP
jgi:hypothetical protein